VPNLLSFQYQRRKVEQEVEPRDNNSWYPVYKRPWYPADTRLVSLISECWIRSKHGCFQELSDFFTLWPRSADIWLIFWYIQLTFLNILTKSVRYLIEIWSIFSWYPFIIPVIFGWYPDIRCTYFQRDVTPWVRYSTFKIYSVRTRIRNYDTKAVWVERSTKSRRHLNRRKVATLVDKVGSLFFAGPEGSEISTSADVLELSAHLNSRRTPSPLCLKLRLSRRCFA